MDFRTAGGTLFLVMLACVLPAGVVVAQSSPTTAPSASDMTQAGPPIDAAPAAGASGVGDGDLNSLNLEQLMQVEVSSNTLTTTERKMTPSAVTSIDRDQIDQANPRNLYELLDIYVPDLYYAYHQWEMPHIGIRGIISDREDKYLLLVNDREMNEQTHAGVLSERDLVLQGDLNNLTVVRGPGSAVYGPGAVEGVIALQTFNGLTYQGTSITARGGVFDEFYSIEAKHGEKTSPDSGWFVYAGAARQEGADRAYSPFIQGQDFPAPYGDAIHGHALNFPFADLGSTYQNDPQLKFHAQYDSGGFTTWARYTMGGTRQTIADRGWLANWPFGWLNPLPPAQSAVGYQQITAFAGYKHDISPTLSVDMSTSLDDTEYVREVPNGGGTSWNNQINESHSEIKSISKALLHWTPNASQQLAGGIEYRHDWLGLPSLRDPGIGALDSTFANDDMPRWQTDMISFVGEDQWKINDQFTTFIGGRVDKHTFTNWLFSPRGAIIYTPNTKDAFKLMGSQSLRTDIEESMKFDHDSTGGKPTDPEIMKTYEFRYERQQNQNLSFASSIYFDDLQVLGWDQNAQATKNLGKYSTIGAEGEINYRTHDTDITFSHSFVKLVNFDLNAGATTSISAAPEGEGWDLASFPQQMTKLTAHRQLNQKWSVDGSLRVDWNFPGDKDFLKFGNNNPINNGGALGSPGSSVPGWNPFGPSAFLDAGIQYKFNEHATLRFDAYNVLGWLNKNLNKRDFVATQWAGQVRDEAPALGVTFKYEF